MADTTILEGQTIEWHITATDADGDNLTFRMNPLATDTDWFGNTASFVDSGNGAALFTFTPGYNFHGGYPISFIVEDGTDIDSIQVLLTVDDVEVPPVWDPINDTTIMENQLLSLLVKAHDPDSNSSNPQYPVLRAEFVDSAGYTFNDNGNGTGEFFFRPNFVQSGIYNVDFVATDSGGLFAIEPFQLTVFDAGNQPPNLDPIPDATILERTTFELGITAMDPDTTKPALSPGVLPANAQFFDSGNGAGAFTFTPDETQYGDSSLDYPVWFYATDGEFIDSLVATFTVIGPNVPPVLDTILDYPTIEGGTLLFDISAADDNGTIPALSTGPLPDSAFFTDNADGTGDFIFTPNYTQAGEYTIMFYAFDNVSYDSQAVLITVADGGDQPPVFMPVDSPLVIFEGDLLELTIEASDPDGRDVTIAMLDTLKNSTFNELSGLFSFSTDLTQGGSYQVRFRATDSISVDSVGLADTLTVYIEVTEVDYPPVLATIGGKYVREGNLLIFPVSGTDPEQGAAALSIFNDPIDSLDQSLYTFTDNGDGTGLFELYADYSITDAASKGLHFTFYARDSVDVDSEEVVVTVFNATQDSDDPGIADSVIVSSLLWDGSPDGFSISTQIWNDSIVAAAGTGFHWSKKWISCDSIAWHLPLRPVGDYHTTFIDNDSSLLYAGFILYDSTYLDSGYHDYFTAYFSYDTTLIDPDTLWNKGNVMVFDTAKVGNGGGFAFDKRLRGPMVYYKEENAIIALDVNDSYTYLPLVNSGIVRAAFNGANLAVYDVYDDRILGTNDTIYIEGSNRVYQLLVGLENPRRLSGIQIGLKISSPDGATWSYASQPGGIGDITHAFQLLDSRMQDVSTVWDLTGGLVISETNIDGIDSDSLMFSGQAGISELAGLSASLTEDVIALNFIAGGVGSGEVKTICFDSVSYGAQPGWGLYEDSLRPTIFSGELCLPVLALTPTDVDDGTILPAIYQLKQNFPNPFNPTTTISFDLPQRGDVKICVYNIIGQEVKVIADRSFDAGTHEVVWDGTDRSGRRAASGIYLYRLESQEFTQTKKMILLK